MLPFPTLRKTSRFPTKNCGLLVGINYARCQLESSNVTHGTDLWRLSLAGVRYAFELARGLGAQVTVYHVVNRDEIMGYADQLKQSGIASSTLREAPDILKRYRAALSRFLEQNLADLLPLLEVNQKVDMGVPHRNIVECARVENVDVIVISTHGRTGLSHVLLGSVTERVVRTAHCPVISIHPERIPEAGVKAAAAG
jgi:universal stress protein A